MMGCRDAVSVGRKTYPRSVIVSLSINKVLNLSVHQSSLSQPWDLSRTKLEYPLVRGVFRIYPATRHYSATLESRNILPKSVLPFSAMSSLTVGPSGG